MERKTRRTFCVVGLLGVVSAIGCGDGKPVERKCWTCKGEGTVDCTRCNGHGYLEVWGGKPRETAACPSCNGAGAKECKTCEGRGKLKGAPSLLERFLHGS